MKRFLAMMTALVMLTCCCAMACADSKMLYPTHELNMETYGKEDYTAHVTFDPADIDSNNAMTYKLYDADIYSVEDVKALQPGDVILVNGGKMTVKTVEEANGGFEINGGFFSDSGEGASLVYVDGDPDHLHSGIYNDDEYRTPMGQVTFALADQVTVRTFEMTEDLDYTGEYDVVTLPAAEVKDYLQSIVEQGVEFYQSNTTLTLLNGKIAEIQMDWAPNI